MRELSLNILDIAQNSLSAKATIVEIVIQIRKVENYLKIIIKDNGHGIDKELLSSVTDPFVTSRKTRRVGLGISFFKLASEMAGGEFIITSEPNVGTRIEASFILNHIDRMPLGDIAGTAVSLIVAKPEADLVLDYSFDERHYLFDTREIKNILDEVPIESPQIITALKEMIDENITKINGLENI